MNSTGAKLWVEGEGDSSYLLPVSDSPRSKSQLHWESSCTLKYTFNIIELLIKNNKQ